MNMLPDDPLLLIKQHIKSAGFTIPEAQEMHALPLIRREHLFKTQATAKKYAVVLCAAGLD